MGLFGGRGNTKNNYLGTERCYDLVMSELIYTPREYNGSEAIPADVIHCNLKASLEEEMLSECHLVTCSLLFSFSSLTGP